MTLIVDTREKIKATQKIIATFDAEGVRWCRSKLVVGDYMSLDNARLAIDRKANLNELVDNVCQGHARFSAELQRARSLGIKLIILIEHGSSIRSLEDIQGWVNPRICKSPLAMSGERFHKVLATMQNKYGISYAFCTKSQTGKRIIQLLEDAQ